MTKFRIYHNPRCTKSRQSLKILEESGETFEIKLYLEEGLSEAEALELKSRLDVPVSDFMRSKEKEYKEMGLGQDSCEADLVKALVEVPKLLERPIILENGSRAVIGRPVEKILAFLGK